MGLPRALLAALPFAVCGGGVAPLCKWPGREFRGDPVDISTITSCPTTFGPPFSIAVTVRFDALSQFGRVFEFGAGLNDNYVAFLHENGGMRLASSFGQAFSGSTSAIVAEEHRFLLTLDGSGNAKMIRGGVEVGQTTGFQAASLQRKLWVGQSHPGAGSNTPLDGAVYDLWIWDQVVPWEDAVVTDRIQPDCEWPGREFSGDYEDLSSLCDRTFGLPLSIAATVRYDAPLVDWMRAFEFGVGVNDNYVAMYLDNSGKLGFSSVLGAGVDHKVVSSAAVVAGEERRYLVTIDHTGLCRLYLEGTEVGQRTGVVVDYLQRTLNVGRSFDGAGSNNYLVGAVRDLWIWQREVQWSDAIAVTQTSTTSRTTRTGTTGTATTASATTTTRLTSTGSSSTRSTSTTFTETTSSTSGTMTSTSTSSLTSSSTSSSSSSATATSSSSTSSTITATATSLTSSTSTSTSSATRTATSTSSATSSTTSSASTSSSTVSTSGTSTSSTTSSSKTLSTSSTSTSSTVSTSTTSSTVTSSTGTRTTSSTSTSSTATTSSTSSTATTTTATRTTSSSSTSTATTTTSSSSTASSTTATGASSSTSTSGTVTASSTATAATATGTSTSSVSTSTIGVPGTSTSTSSPNNGSSSSSITTSSTDTHTVSSAADSIVVAFRLRGVDPSADLREALERPLLQSLLLEGASLRDLRLQTTLEEGQGVLSVWLTTGLLPSAARLVRALTPDSLGAAVLAAVKLRGVQPSLEGMTVALGSAAPKENVLILEAWGQAMPLLEQLNRSSESALTASSGLVAARLKGKAVLSVPVPEMAVSVKVEVPASVAAGLAAEGELAVVASVVRNVSSLGGGVGVEAAMVIEVGTLAGDAAKVSGLLEPIEFELPAPYVEGMLCAFWKEGQGEWSTEGVAVMEGSVEGEPIRCATWHLSVFGAILRGVLETFACSQFNLLSLEALRNLRRQDWLPFPGSRLYFALLFIMGLGFLAAGAIDYKRSRQQRWSMEYFLVPLEPAGETPPEEEEENQELGTPSGFVSSGSVANLASYVAPEAAEEVIEEVFLDVAEQPGLRRFREHGVIIGMVLSASACCAAFFECCKNSALKDALDEIASEYFEQFAEVRNCLEGVWQGLEFSSFGARRLFSMSQKLMSQLVITSSRHLAGATLGLNKEVVTFVLEDKELLELLVQREERRRRSGVSRASEVSRASGVSGFSEAMAEGEAWYRMADREEAWWALHQEVQCAMDRHVAKMRWCSVPATVCEIFLANNPLGSIFTMSIFRSCKLRAFFRMMELAGDLMVVCLFYAASGRAKGKPGAGQEEAGECGSAEELQEEISYKLGRILAIAMASVVLAGMPVNMLQSLQTRKFKKFPYEGCRQWRRQLRAWRMQGRVIWVLGSLYLAFCLSFIALFLANISPEDHGDWFQAGGLSLLLDTFLLPFAIAMCMPTLAAAFVTAVSRLGKVERTTLIREVRSSVHARSSVRSSARLPVIDI